MKTIITKALLIAILGKLGTNATPVDSAGDMAPLAKRTAEIVYLANCESAVSCCTPNQIWSDIIYYPDSNQSHNGETPTSDNQCQVTTPSQDYNVLWEGQTQKCTFPTAVTFTSKINADGAGKAVGQFAGTGSNGFKNFNCYRDNNRKLFQYTGPEHASWCISIYYCTDA